MDARVPIIVKDPEVTKYKEIPATEPYTIRNEEVLLDGPVSTRVAVIDFDPKQSHLDDFLRAVLKAGFKVS